MIKPRWYYPAALFLALGGLGLGMWLHGHTQGAPATKPSASAIGGMGGGFNSPFASASPAASPSTSPAAKPSPSMGAAPDAGEAKALASIKTNWALVASGLSTKYTTAQQRKLPPVVFVAKLCAADKYDKVTPAAVRSAMRYCAAANRIEVLAKAYNSLGARGPDPQIQAVISAWVFYAADNISTAQGPKRSMANKLGSLQYIVYNAMGHDSIAFVVMNEGAQPNGPDVANFYYAAKEMGPW